MAEFTHIDEHGSVRMVDVSEKEITERTAVARGKISMSRECLEAIKGNTLKKGDALACARVAGIMAVKRTSDIIPLCHPLFITKCGVEMIVSDDDCAVEAVCTVKCSGKTGVEMEALTGASAALLTVYDMCKAIDKRMVIGDIHLVEKDGGRSGHFLFDK